MVLFTVRSILGCIDDVLENMKNPNEIVNPERWHLRPMAQIPGHFSPLSHFVNVNLETVLDLMH